MALNLLSCTAALLLSPIAAGAAAPDTRPLFDAADGRQRLQFQTVLPRVLHENPPCLAFDGTTASELTLPLEPLGLATDWTGWSYLEVEAENRSPGTLRLTVLLRTVPGSMKDLECAGLNADLPAGKPVRFKLPLRHLPYSYSGWEWSSLPGDLPRSEGCWGRVHLDRLKEIVLAQWGTRGLVTIRSLRLTDPYPATGWIDRFGQASGFTCDRRVETEADLVTWDRKEQQELASPRVYGDRDGYQAWTAGPELKPSLLFRVEKVGERWWLVAPSGRVFFSTGMNCVLPTGHGLIQQTARTAYQWLPEKSGAFAGAWKDDQPSFYLINLIRKWGDGWAERFHERALARQQAWGFTTIASYSDAAQYWAKKLPYVTMGPGAWYDWPALQKASLDGLPQVTPKMLDPFHPDFEKRVLAYTEASLARFKGDPWCVGHFIHNELDWHEWPKAIFGLPATQPARAWLRAELEKRHGDIQSLNRAWGTNASSFDAIRWPPKESGQPKPGTVMAADMASLRGAFADRWYRIWCEAVRNVCPGHLVLGSRLHHGDEWPEVVDACARWVDVVSFNHYKVVPDTEMFDRIYARTRKPMLIGEYGHNSRDEGHLTAAVPVRDQKARGDGFRAYTERLAALPYFVGCHYFQYIDEPLTGRFDTETAYNGFVNVADIPNGPMTRAARQTHERLYHLHAGTLAPYADLPER